MKNDISLFQKYCEKAIGALTNEVVEQFKSFKDEESRINLMYDFGKKIPIDLGSETKNIEISKSEKEKGNAFFTKKNYDSALKSYNVAILNCPQNTENERELLSILISNRSACYFKLREYKRVFNDIDYLMEIDGYPTHLQYKIWFRKAQCYDELHNEKMAQEAYSLALKCLNQSKLDDKTKSSTIKEIKDAMESKKNEGSSVCSTLAPSLFLDQFKGGSEYVSAYSGVGFRQDIYQGRYAEALEDIEIGTVILEEKPHSSVLDLEHTMTNCQYCFVSVDQPIACPTCNCVVYCSSNCQKLANKSFHGTECAIQPIIFKCGASVNCLLAMRIITQHPINFFKDKKSKLRDYLRDGCKKSIIKKKIYKSDDYDNVFFLCTNNHLRKKEELIHYSCMAIFLLRLIKMQGYFGEFNDEVLTEDELYIGSLILRHLQMLQFNAHEISELRNQTTSKQASLLSNYESSTIGAGLYPTLALFNHSCDPSIVRYNVKNTMVVRTIKPIKAGDIIYENYGPLYMSMELHKRQEELQKNYWFECLCQACVEMWPLYNEMNQNELRIPCKTERCPFVFTVKYDDDPFLICDYCQNTTGIFTSLRALMTLDEILPEAENLYMADDLQLAMEKFIMGLKVLFKYSRSPHPEIIKVQQRIRNCMVHFGNKACGYKIKL